MAARFSEDMSRKQGEKNNLDELYEKSFAYTAIICSSDYYAAMLLNTFQDRGRKIPDDISITGFNDVDTPPWYRPALTTVRQDIQEKGLVAVDMLVKITSEENCQGHGDTGCPSHTDGHS